MTTVVAVGRINNSRKRTCARIHADIEDVTTTDDVVRFCTDPDHLHETGLWYQTTLPQP